MASANPTTVRFEQDQSEKIDEFVELMGEDTTQSDAIKEMVEIAHREAKHPLTYRLKDDVVDWVGQLGIAAVIVFVGGATTPVLPIGEAALFSISLVVVAILMLAGFEMARLVLGSNELGARVRSQFSRGDAA